MFDLCHLDKGLEYLRISVSVGGPENNLQEYQGAMAAKFLGNQKFYADFFICPGVSAQTPMSFKSQQYRKHVSVCFPKSWRVLAC